MKRLVIVGATGMVGGYALRYALEHPDVEQVTSVGRRKLSVSNAKLTEVLHRDFTDCSALADVLSRQDAAVFCLGAYTGAVSDADLRRITVDCAIEFARVFHDSSPAAALSFLSGTGADPTGRSRVAFARYKGEAEKALLAMGFSDVYIFRPAYIYPVEPRKEPNFGYRLLRAIYPLFRRLFPIQVIRSDELARAMVDVAIGRTREGHGPVLENRDIRALASQRSSGRSWLLWPSVIVVALSALAVVLLHVWPALGAEPSGERLSRMRGSPHWSAGRFANEQPLWTNTRSGLMRVFESTPGDVPDAPVLVLNGGKALRNPATSGLRVTWFGHSSTLLEIDGVTVLIDPLWSERASPLSWIGPKRWYPPPVALRELPRVDVVMISHDHYDHLDRATITAMAAMANWSPTFVTPLGVGASLERWGIPAAHIVELEWWQSTRVGSLEIIATPARHASGRISPQSDVTLWAGYAFLGTQHRVWYSGDTGFHSALEEIGQRFGPFDVTLIEAGQYDKDWPDWHLGPEQAVEAHRLVRGKRMIPVHWGLLNLAHHSWTEPVERVLVAAKCRNVDVLVPRPGESIEPAHSSARVRWWTETRWLSAHETPIVATRDGVASQRFEVLPCDRSGS